MQPSVVALERSFPRSAMFQDKCSTQGKANAERMKHGHGKRFAMWKEDEGERKGDNLAHRGHDLRRGGVEDGH